MNHHILFLAGVFLLSAFGLGQVKSEPLTAEDYLRLPKAVADHRIAYGNDALQFGDLRLPGGAGPHPVVIIVHGGCWMAEYGLEPLGEFAAALSREGVATWSLEFRRVGNPGGGWPGTFQDVAAGADYVRELAKRFPLDLTRVSAVGHSSGGHLAAWLAARMRLGKNSLLYFEDPIRLHGLVVLAGVPDMRDALTGGLRAEGTACSEATRQIMGGMPDEVPDHFLQGSPIELLPFGVPQHNIVGNRDNPLRLDMITRYTEHAKSAGDQSELTILEGAGHFDIINTNDKQWPAIREIILTMAGIR